MRRFLLAAVMCGAASVAQAADMPDLPFLRGSFTDGLSSARVNWQGFYVGGQASYGSTTSNVAPGANTDLQSSFIPPNGVSYNWQSLPSAHTQHHRLRRVRRIQFAVGRRRGRSRGELHP